MPGGPGALPRRAFGYFSPVGKVTRGTGLEAPPERKNKMNYTAQDFEKALASSGLSGQFSRWDLDTAQKNPDFGMGILSAKQNYNAAATPEQKILANEEANDLRRRYGYYSGGSNGAQYLPTGQMTPQIYGKIEEIGSFPDYQEPYKDMYNSALDRLGSMGSFSYDKAAPTYTNAYADLQKKLLDSVVNRDPFTWSKETDPQWGSYKKSYLREGERATANALAQASAASGGRPSSYAVNAATQAGDYYAAKLNDMIPTLYQQAYDRYLQEFQMDRQKLGDVNTQEQIDYNRYLTDLGQYNTDRDFALNVYNSDFDRNNAYLNAIMELDNMAYGRYSDSYDRLLSQLGVYQGQEDREYNRYNDSLDRALQLQGISQQRQEQKQGDAQRMVDSILSVGGTPSAELLAEAGYPSEYSDAILQDYRRQQLEKVQEDAREQISNIFKVGGVPSQELIDMSGLSPDYIKIMSTNSKQQSAPSSGGSRRSSGSRSSSSASSASNSSGDNYDGLFAAAQASGHPASYIANHYKEFGFKSSSGLSKEYEQWAEEMEDSSPTQSGGARLEDIDSNSVLSLGLGPLDYNGVDALAEAGMLDIFSNGDKVSVKWANGWNEDKAKEAIRSGRRVPGIPGAR